MYSWEIDLMIKRLNYNLSAEEYINITNIERSPQIVKIERKWDGSFFIATNDNYSWEVNIKENNYAY